jgi:hypothetical protein
MSWLEDLAGSVMKGVGENIVPIAGAIYSGYQTGNANQRAVELAQQGAASGIRSINAGAAASQGALNTITNNAAPATSYIRNVMATNPGQMNPWQVQALNDARLAAANQTAHTGSGRGTAIINDGQNRLTAQFQKDNTGRADAAANTLAGQGHTAAIQAAGIPMQAGSAEAGLTMGAANNAANATVANAGTQASTLAAIAGYTNRQQADEQAQRRYRTVTAGNA